MKQQQVPDSKFVAKQSKDSVLAEKRVATEIEDIQEFIWIPKHPDTTRWLCELHFRDEYAVNFFHGQCAYFFFTNTTFAKGYEQVELIWTYKTDCVFDIPYLKRPNGIKSYPKVGDSFAVYKLLNDTTLTVEYRFPSWVDKVNQIAKDSLFPRRLYLWRAGGA